MPSSRSDRDFLKELKRKDKKRRKQKRKRRHHSDSSSDSSSEDSDMDLQKELHPISHYANDREEMINQVFSVIQGKKLKSMLPPFLADLDIDEVKALCLEQLIGMSKKRVLCTLNGQEMVDSSDTDDDDDQLSDGAGKEERDSESEEEEGRTRGESSVSQDPSAATSLKKVHRIKIAKKSQTKIVLKGDKGRNDKEKQKEGEDKGKTLMELLELEMRARAIKALLMKSGKNESEAETLAIEEALDEQKKKQETKKGLVENASTMKERHLRKKSDDSDDSGDGPNGNEAESAAKDESDSDEEPERVFNSENNAMSKARDALLLSENKKRIEDEVKTRKEEEAKFLYEEQLRKEKEEEERQQREKLVKEVKMMKQKLIEEEQEQRRKKIEEEKEKMRLDHERKEALKQIKDKEKLLSKIQALKDEEEKEKEELQEHYKTKIQKKVVDRADDEDMMLDDSDEQKHRRYRKKDSEDDLSDEERRPYDRSSSRSSSRSPKRRPYSRDQSDDEEPRRRSGGKTRLRRKVADGSDVEDGEVEEVDSDAEDEIEREEDQVNLLEKMKNLRKKFSEMEDSKTEEEKNSNPSSPQPQSTRGGRGRGRGGARGRGRGRGKGKEDDEEWSMQKYDFDAPDIKDAVESHKPNFVKDQPKSSEKQDENDSNNDKMESKEEPKSTFKRVSREEWNKMTKIEKKKYLRERKKWKLSQTVFIKDDSDNEQLTDEDENEEAELKYSDSEDEKEKQDRLAREALKSYAGAFEKEEAPKDYKLVMRKDIVEHELADTDDHRYETVEDIEIREKREKLEMKEQERKAKMREDRLRRMQAFQASSVLREEPVEDQEQMEVEVETCIEKIEPEEEKPADDNPFYSSYEALETKDILEDPLREERERVKAQQEEDEKELRKIHNQQEKNSAVFDETSMAPPQKKAKIEIGSMSLGALKTMIDSDKEKIQKEFDVEAEKTKDLEKKDKDVRKKKAEQVLRRSKRRGDPNNPSKEEVDAAQELEQMTWQDRYMKNRKVKDVVEKSQLLSKVKNKMKEDKKEKEQEVPGLTDPPAVADKKEGKQEEEENSMIGSIEEYANLVGKSVSKLAETKYEAPEVEEEEEEESDNEGDDLWGAIMGGS